jgi:hypothetical protein
VARSCHLSRRERDAPRALLPTTIVGPGRSPGARRRTSDPPPPPPPAHAERKGERQQQGPEPRPGPRSHGRGDHQAGEQDNVERKGSRRLNSLQQQPPPRTKPRHPTPVPALGAKPPGAGVIGDERPGRRGHVTARPCPPEAHDVAPRGAVVRVGSSRRLEQRDGFGPAPLPKDDDREIVERLVVLRTQPQRLAGRGLRVRPPLELEIHVGQRRVRPRLVRGEPDRACRRLQGTRLVLAGQQGIREDDVAAVLLRRQPDRGERLAPGSLAVLTAQQCDRQDPVGPLALGAG